jgi:hypothetical protein
MAFSAPGVTWLAGSLAGMCLSAAFAAVTASLAWVILFSAAGMAVFFAAAESSGVVSRVASSRSAAARACPALRSRARPALRSGLPMRWVVGAAAVEAGQDLGVGPEDLP